MRVKDIMTKKVISLKPDDNAKEALDILLKMHISGLPVIDDKGSLQGMFTEKEILVKVLPSYMDKVGPFVYDENPKTVKLKAHELSNMKVKDVMRHEVVTVNEDTVVCEVAHLILTKKARRLPVLNQENKVVGIVAREDVVKALFSE
jgi:CBS domain-containing protein